MSASARPPCIDFRQRRISRRCLALAVSLAAGLFGPGQGFARAQPAASLPAVIGGTLGEPSFDERFSSLDWGVDQTRPARPHKWRTVFGYGGPASPGNRQLSALALAVDRDFRGQDGGAPLGIDPFSIGPDGLTITATKVGADKAARMWGKTWASGVLTTKFSFSQLHGYFEADMDLPTCVKGAWPAFWLLPVNGTWPEHGEIDVPETIGNGKIYWSVKTRPSAPGKDGGSQFTSPGNCTRGWHRYGVLWRSDAIGFYYDRKLVAQTPTPPDYSVPMFMLLNLAVGGSWPGNPDPSLRQVSMQVRRVTAWKLEK
jgi:hypothetical protein